MADGEEEERMASLERELQAAREEVKRWEKKAAQYENASAELDDDSFDAAQVFQLKKQLEEVQEELGRHDEMKKELADAKMELAELRSQNEELELQQSRRSTRTDIQRIRSEKATREEIERLHKELRQMERSAKSQASLVDAQMKASKESLQRAAEKTQALQRRLDLVDKERMDLKLENQRLTRKLEKSDSYAEKKRAQMEAETQQMEIDNLKRKTVKLEKRLSLSTMNLSSLSEVGPFNITSPPPGQDSRTDSRLSSGTSSPIPLTLSEARVENLEKEVYALEEQNSALESQNEKLKDELLAAEQKANILLVQVEQLQVSSGGTNNGVDVQAEDMLLAKLPQYSQNSLPQEPTENGETQTEEGSAVHGLQQDVAKLQKKLEDKETEMRVRIKEMKATNEELKRQVEELEMEKLRLELGEDEEDGEATDTEEDLKPNKDAPPEEESDESEVKVLRERLMSLQDELVNVSKNNENLQTRLQKQQEEAESFMKSIETELNQALEAQEERSREERLKEKNEELKSKLQEQKETNNKMSEEIAHLKKTIEEQEEEIVLLKVQRDELERQLSTTCSEANQEPEILMNGNDFNEQGHTQSSDIIEESTPAPKPEAIPQKGTASPKPQKGRREKKSKNREKLAPVESDALDGESPVSLSQESAEVSTPPLPVKEKKSGKKFGGILSSKKSKFQGEEADDSSQQNKKPPPKKPPPRQWPPNPKKK